MCVLDNLRDSSSPPVLRFSAVLRCCSWGEATQMSCDGLTRFGRAPLPFCFVIHSVGPKASAAGVEVIADVAERHFFSARLLGDAFRLRQCCINLVDNVRRTTCTSLVPPAFLSRHVSVELLASSRSLTCISLLPAAAGDQVHTSWRGGCRSRLLSARARGAGDARGPRRSRRQRRRSGSRRRVLPPRQLRLRRRRHRRREPGDGAGGGRRGGGAAQQPRQPVLQRPRQGPVGPHLHLGHRRRNVAGCAGRAVRAVFTGARLWCIKTRKP